jgi:SAM-dependent methyltransferase
MRVSEFDKFAQEYGAVHAANITVSGEAPEYFAAYKIRDLHDLSIAAGLSGGVQRILDFGAGIGESVSHMRQRFGGAELTCVDVSLKSLHIGVGRFGGEASFLAFDGRRLPFADGAFDCIFSACVFHHIEPALHVGILAELRRVLRPGGLIAIYEHNPLNPLTVQAVRTCEFDDSAILLRAGQLRARLAAAGFAQPRVRYRVFFPHALRWLRPMERWLQWLPLGAQYYAYDLR